MKRPRVSVRSRQRHQAKPTVLTQTDESKCQRHRIKEHSNPKLDVFKAVHYGINSYSTVGERLEYSEVSNRIVQRVFTSKLNPASNENNRNGQNCFECFVHAFRGVDQCGRLFVHGVSPVDKRKKIWVYRETGHQSTVDVRIIRRIQHNILRGTQTNLQSNNAACDQNQSATFGRAVPEGKQE